MRLKAAPSTLDARRVQEGGSGGDDALNHALACARPQEEMATEAGKALGKRIKDVEHAVRDLTAKVDTLSKDDLEQLTPKSAGGAGGEAAAVKAVREEAAASEERVNERVDDLMRSMDEVGEPCNVYPDGVQTDEATSRLTRGRRGRGTDVSAIVIWSICPVVIFFNQAGGIKSIWSICSVVCSVAQLTKMLFDHLNCPGRCLPPAWFRPSVGSRRC